MIWMLFEKNHVYNLKCRAFEILPLYLKQKKFGWWSGKGKKQAIVAWNREMMMIFLPKINF